MTARHAASQTHPAARHTRSRVTDSTHARTHESTHVAVVRDVRRGVLQVGDQHQVRIDDQVWDEVQRAHGVPAEREHAVRKHAQRHKDADVTLRCARAHTHRQDVTTQLSPIHAHTHMHTLVMSGACEALNRAECGLKCEFGLLRYLAGPATFNNRYIGLQCMHHIIIIAIVITGKHCSAQGGLTSQTPAS